jgi:hypothetical protein
LSQGSIALSHGLLMSVLWSVTIAGIAHLVWRDRKVSALLGIVTFNHWVMDFLMHSNLPLFFEGSPMVGLGLENSGPGFLFITIFDLVFLAIGLFVYFRMRKKVVEGLQRGAERGVQVKPPPFLPQIRKSTGFGGGECKVFMNIEVVKQFVIVFPPFSSRWFLRDANGGTRRGPYAAPKEK